MLEGLAMIGKSSKLFLIAFLVSLAPARAECKDGVVGYPQQLLGTWELASHGQCTLPIDQDTHSAIVIDRRFLGRYEETQKPERSRAVSSDPLVWRIDSRSDVDGYQSLETAIYILDQYGKLTVADSNRTEVYLKCSPENRGQNAFSEKVL